VVPIRQAGLTIQEFVNLLQPEDDPRIVFWLGTTFTALKKEQL
jgi:hypothetical protein